MKLGKKAILAALPLVLPTFAQANYTLSCKGSFERTRSQVKVSAGPEFDASYSRIQRLRKTSGERLKAELAAVENATKILEDQREDQERYQYDRQSDAIITKFIRELREGKRFVSQIVSEETTVTENFDASASLPTTPQSSEIEKEIEASFASSKGFPEIKITGYIRGYHDENISVLLPHYTRVAGFSFHVNSQSQDIWPGQNLIYPQMFIYHTTVGSLVSSYGMDDRFLAHRKSRQCTSSDYAADLPWYEGDSGRLLRIEDRQEGICRKAFFDTTTLPEIDFDGLPRYIRIRAGEKYSVADDLKRMATQYDLRDQYILDSNSGIFTSVKTSLKPNCMLRVN